MLIENDCFAFKFSTLSVCLLLSPVFFLPDITPSRRLSAAGRPEQGTDYFDAPVPPWAPYLALRVSIKLFSLLQAYKCSDIFRLIRVVRHNQLVGNSVSVVAKLGLV